MRWKVRLTIIGSFSIAVVVILLVRSTRTKQISLAALSPSTTQESDAVLVNRTPRRLSRRARVAFSEDPLEIAMAAEQPDNELTIWLQTWENSWSDGKVCSEKEREELLSLVKRTTLGTVPLLGIAHAFHATFINPETSAIFYDAAAHRANDELNANSDSAANNLVIVQSINHHREDLKDVMWPLIEKGDKTSLNTLAILYTDLLRFAPAGNKKFDGVVQTVTTGLAECLFLQNKMDESLDLLERNSSQKLSKERRSALDWAWSLVLVREHRFREALPHLESVANDQRFTYRTASIPVLIRAYCASGQPADADTWYDKYLADCHPGFSAAVDAATDIEFAKAKFK